MLGTIIRKQPLVASLSLLALFGVCRDSGAQSLIPRSAETMVNSTTTGEQFQPRVALGPNSELFIVWDSSEPVAARGALFSADGRVLRSDFLINPYPASSCSSANPSIASGSCGRFLVAWTGDSDTGGGVCATQVQLFNSAGARIAPQLQMGTAGSQEYATEVVWEPSAERFWVFWGKGGQGLSAAVLDSSGNIVVPAFHFGHAALNFSIPSAAAGGDGTVVVVWAAADSGASYGVYGQRFLASGQPLGSEFTIQPPPGATPATGDGATAMRPDGSFAAFWGLGAFPDSTLRGKAFDSLGLSSPIPLGYQGFYPDTALDPAGAYLVSATFWSIVGGNSEWEIDLFLVDQDGTVLVDPVLVNQRLDGEQQLPKIASDAAGRIAVVWSTSTTLDGDPSGSAIALRLFRGRSTQGPLIFAADFESGDLAVWGNGCS